MKTKKYELTPNIAAKLASTVYGFMDLTTSEALNEFKVEMEGNFAIRAA